jgi:hypothetical protein
MAALTADQQGQQGSQVDDDLQYCKQQDRAKGPVEEHDEQPREFR